jgi:chemotaxis protein CheX
MDVKYINPFMSSIRNVFQTMLSLDVTFGKPGIKTDPHASHDVSGVIGLSGDVDGVVVVSFPRLAAVRIASTFAGVNLSEVDDDFPDAIGELANMISGNAKKDLDGLKVFISPPSVVVGASHQIKSTKIIPRLVIPCSTLAGSFVVEVGIRVVNKPAELLAETAAEAI